MSDLLIGDISGYKQAFDQLVKSVPGISRIVALGDIIDRGPESRQMIEFFMDHPQHVCLMGNHEHMMIKCYEEIMEGKKNPYQLIFWIYVNGGKETLESYGVSVPEMTYSRSEIINMMSNERKKLNQELISQIKEEFSKIPQSHITFLKTLPMFMEIPTAFYSHASIKNWQNPKLFQYQAFEGNDLLLDIGCLWNRSLPDKARPDGKFYVYGHQNKAKPLIHSKKYPGGKYLDELETHLPSDSWGACIDTVKAGFLTGLKIDDLSIYYAII